MNKFIFVAAGFLSSSMILIGCSPENGRTPTPKDAGPIVVTNTATPAPDPMSASEMVKKHPRLQKICDAAGGCDNVTIECILYDDTGNTNLRNLKWWTISGGGAKGSGWHDRNSNRDYQSIEQAINAWQEDWTWEHRPREKEDVYVYPNSQSCNPTTCK